MAQNRNSGIPEKGEGNHAADERYRDETKRFIESGRVDSAAEDARRAMEDEADELLAAEAEGRARAKEEDPEVEDKD